MADVQGATERMTVCAIFPGHGGESASETPVVLTHPAAAAAIDEASEAAGWAVLTDARSDQVEPAGQAVEILATNVAMHRAMEAQGLRLALMAGHSLGELCAAVAARSLSLGDAVRVLVRRGELIRQITGCSMLAVHGVTVAQVEQIVADLGRPLHVATVNGERALAVAGRVDDLAAFREATRGARGCRIRGLSAAAPFHTPLMAPILDGWCDALGSVVWADPAVPIASCIDGHMMTTGEHVAASLRDQLTTRVDWPATIRACCDAGTECFVELGIGGMLSGLHRGLRCGVPCVDVTRSRSQRALAELLRDGGGD
jgi:malonyl CoA-acyl carrier protein transacylase